MKIAVIGASSFIGTHLYLNLKSEFGAANVVGTYFSHPRFDDLIRLDATDLSAVENFLQENHPELIVLVAGNKNVKQCEESYDLAYKFNVLPLFNLLQALEKNTIPKTRILLFSSDYVFCGEKGNYAPEDATSPVTNYGKSKREAEMLLLNHVTPGTIIRTSAVMGKGGIFFDWLIDSLQKDESLELFSDSFFTPTPMSLLLEVISALIRQSLFDKHDIVHIVGGKRLSRFDFAQCCKKLMAHHAAILKPVCRDINNTIPYDLSMRPSPIAMEHMSFTFEQYLQKELLS